MCDFQLIYIPASRVQKTTSTSPSSPFPVDRDNRNNSIKRSGILFSRTDRGGYCQGGGEALIGSAAVSLLLLTQAGRTMCAGHFYSRLFALPLGREGLKKEENEGEGQ